MPTQVNSTELLGLQLAEASQVIKNTPGEVRIVVCRPQEEEGEEEEGEEEGEEEEGEEEGEGEEGEEEEEEEENGTAERPEFHITGG